MGSIFDPIDMPFALPNLDKRKSEPKFVIALWDPQNLQMHNLILIPLYTHDVLRWPFLHLNFEQHPCTYHGDIQLLSSMAYSQKWIFSSTNA